MGIVGVLDNLPILSKFNHQYESGSIMKSIFWVLLSLSVILLGACATPTVTPVPASIPAPEPTISSNYTTYTDEANIFSISYPSDWEHINVREFLKTLGSETSSKSIEAISSSTLFMSGVPTGKGYSSPFVQVLRQPYSGKGLKLDDLVEAVIKDAKDSFQDFKVLLRTGTTIDGREGVIIEVETETYYPGMERANQLQMFTLNENNIWVVTFTSKLEEFTKYKDDFYHIVGSLRIIK